MVPATIGQEANTNKAKIIIAQVESLGHGSEVASTWLMQNITANIKEAIERKGTIGASQEVFDLIGALKDLRTD